MKIRRTAIQIAIAAACASAAHAATPDESTLETIEVTASRRAMATKDIPYSVQAIDASAIKDQNMQQFEDYLGEIPGIGFGNRGEGRTDIFLRGISSPGVGRSAVGLYVDEIPLAFSGFQPDTNIYDMARIEVLKGPQGTLYGEGALGGAIKLITNKPKLDAFEASARATFSAVDNGRVSPTLNAMVNAPLISNKLALRVVATRNNERGWIDNLRTGDDDVNSSRTTSLRAQLAFDPIEDLSVLLTYMSKRGHVDAQNFTDFASDDLTSHHRPFDEPTNERSNTYNLTGNWKLTAGTVTFSASKSDRSLDESTWASVNSEQIGAAFGIPDYVLTLNTHSNFDVDSQELRFVSAGESRFQYVLGAFHKTREQPFVAIVPNPPPSQFLGLEELYNNVVRDKDEETAVFGEATYDLTTALHLTAGARFSHEKNDVRSDLFIFYAGQIPTQSGRAKHDSVSPRIALGYDLTSTQTVYATVGKGYRAGGANFQIDPTQGDPLSYDPDTAINYEVGHKANWLNGRLATEIAVYHLDWRDVQVFTNSPDGARSYTFNGGKARSTGVEVEVRVRPMPGLDLALGASYLDAEYRTAIPEVGVARGAELPFSPNFSGFASVGYAHSIGADMEGFVLAQVQHTGDRRDSVRRPIDAYTPVDLRFGVRRASYEVAVFGENLFNSLAAIDNVFSLGAQIPNRPRTVGVSLSASF